MNVRILSVVGLGLVLSDCSGGPCGGQTCTDAQRCTSTQICVADESPTLALELPIENQMVTGATVMVKGTANDDTAVAQLSVAFGSAMPVTIPFPGSGTFAAEVDVPTADAKPVQLTVTAMDPKRKGVSVTRTIQVDNVAPTCAMSVPAVVTSVGDFVVMTTAADGSGTLTNARFSSDGALTFTPVTGSAFTWVVNTENGVMHALVFRIEDGAGHVCEAKADVLVDNVKPTIGFTSPDAGALLGKAFFLNGGVLSGPASDGARPLKTVMVEFADAGVHQAAVANDQWSLAVAAPVTDDFALESATVTATDFADNTASATLSVTVDVVAPALAITAPAVNAKLNIATFAGGDDVPLAWTVADGDPQPTVVLLEPDGGTRSPAKLTTSPSDNGKAYTVTLRAVDRAGNAATASSAFSVDRVAPTVTATVPANNTRMFPGVAAADFSEPMTATAEGLTLTPDAGGSWTTPQKWTSGALTKDTVYAATSSATDLYGNPAAPFSWAFHTAPFIAAPGTVLATGVATVTAATTDQDGVLSVLVKDGVGTPAFIQVSAVTGMPYVISMPTWSALALLSAWTTTSASLAADRIVGFTSTSGTTNQVVRVMNGVFMGGPLADAFIPMPAFPGEGAGLAPFAYIRNGNYERAGRAPVPINLPFFQSLQLTAKRWELGNYLAGSHTQTFGCYAANTFPPSTVCAMQPVVDLPAGGFSAATSAPSGNCTLNITSPPIGDETTLVRWQPGCGLTPCTPDQTAAGSADDVVADLNNDGTFYSVARVGSVPDGGPGVYWTRKLVTNGVCAGTWADAGTLALETRPRPVVIRGVPLLVYADGNGNLKLAAP